MEHNSALNVSSPGGLVAAAPGRANKAARPKRAPFKSPFRLRPVTIDDAEILEGIEREAFPTLYPPTRFRRELSRSNAAYLVASRDWTEEELLQDPQVLKPGADAPEVRNVLGHLRDAVANLVFERIGRTESLPHEYIAGMVGLWFVLDEAHIVIIGSRPRDRRQGIGELLLIGAIEEALRRGQRVVTLEVRESNEAARSLYRKYGFREVGLRKRYYADNGEDAVIMTTPPIQSEEYRAQFSALVSNHAERWGRSERVTAEQTSG